MTIPQTSANIEISDAAQRSEPTVLRLRPARRLPVQKDWPTSAIVVVQIGILVAILAAWEIGAATGFIDKFFWSHPSAIYHTLTIFFTTGDAFTDIAFTFRSTILGFFIGTFAGSALGLSFWWSKNYAAIVQPYIICFESLPKLALAPLIAPRSSCWCSVSASPPRSRSPPRSPWSYRRSPPSRASRRSIPTARSCSIRWAHRASRCSASS
jgi:NitT/TauT family transport system permease protein